ncbi:dihydropteroate synthase [Methylacidiphilum kamchatkense Kam1]|uniref:Dihydropteroate synthase n=2 Tax=Methylacidiphilum kamchatkense TaxID=431057 RepID=A0A0C1UQA1_9BACT|nr:dihydropteroate synthase [Methylacidiphilum kamchatkense Kam1]QDQ41660.1 dihydropteroate synthase [Methylacidiphilum kamchatkense Kam1]
MLKKEMQWNIGKKKIVFPMGRPLIMGIINITPDSFSDGGRYLNPQVAADRAFWMQDSGVDLIDLGAESTRPGAEPVSEKEEMTRLLPVLQRCRAKLTIPLSIDTYKSKVCQMAIDHGADIINDVSGGGWDPEILPVVARSSVGYILVHSRGMPKTMQKEAQYHDIVEEVFNELSVKLDRCLQAGIDKERIICDVGFGFAKDKTQNLILLRRLSRFHDLGRPLMIGVSRKSFLQAFAKRHGVDVEMMNIIAQTVAFWQGVEIWRVHDVATAVAARDLLEKIWKADCSL